MCAYPYQIDRIGRSSRRGVVGGAEFLFRQEVKGDIQNITLFIYSMTPPVIYHAVSTLLPNEGILNSDVSTSRYVNI